MAFLDVPAFDFRNVSQHAVNVNNHPGTHVLSVKTKERGYPPPLEVTCQRYAENSKLLCREVERLSGAVVCKYWAV
jgi:hypothetical protein